MGPLASLFPDMPWTPIEIAVHVLAALGTILIIYGVFLECERRQDIVFGIGALSLLVYSIWLGNILFCVAMGGFALACFIELIEILLGRHVHSEELVEKYRHPNE